MKGREGRINGKGPHMTYGSPRQGTKKSSRARILQTESLSISLFYYLCTVSRLSIVARSGGRGIANILFT